MSKVEALYKLTDKDGYARRHEAGETLWAPGKKLSLDRAPKPQLCTSDVIHAYRNLNLGLLLNPLHANFSDPLPWKAKGRVVVFDWGKVGCFTLTVTKRAEIPAWFLDDTMRARVQIFFAVLCGEAVLRHYENRFPDDDRPRKAIEAARAYLKSCGADAAAPAAYAADAAAYTAYAAAYTADAAAYAADAADAAARAADAAAPAAYAAAYAADTAEIDFGALADLAVEEANK